MPAAKKLTLTFDNGPDPTCTPGVLDVLRDRGIHSTFFVCAQGNEVHAAMSAGTRQGRELLDRIRDEGHWIGNHTLTHTVELGTTVDIGVIEREIGTNQILLGEYNPMRLFRPYMAGGNTRPVDVQSTCDSLSRRQRVHDRVVQQLPSRLGEPDGLARSGPGRH
jgi:peptidoglycan-N-acetylglucosamine deacetylase